MSRELYVNMIVKFILCRIRVFTAGYLHLKTRV